MWIDECRADQTFRAAPAQKLEKPLNDLKDEINRLWAQQKARIGTPASGSGGGEGVPRHVRKKPRKSEA